MQAPSFTGTLTFTESPRTPSLPAAASLKEKLSRRADLPPLLGLSVQVKQNCGVEDVRNFSRFAAQESQGKAPSHLWSSPVNEGTFLHYAKNQRLSLLWLVARFDGRHDAAYHANDMQGSMLLGALILLHQGGAPSSPSSSSSPSSLGNFQGLDFQVPARLGARAVLVVKEKFRQCGAARILLDMGQGCLKPEDKGSLSVEVPSSEQGLRLIRVFENIGFTVMQGVVGVRKENAVMCRRFGRQTRQNPLGELCFRDMRSSPFISDS